MKKFLFVVLILLILLLVFKSLWVRDQTKELETESQIIQTATGPIEYTKKGSGPVVVCLHGGPGGYDQSLLIGSNLLDQGFTVIGVSRPGYLRTPLSVGQTNEQQADAIINLLDSLGITKAAALGFSAGGPVVFQMALRHPERVWGLVMESIGAHVVRDETAYKRLNTIIQLDGFADFIAWPIFEATKHQMSTEGLLLRYDTLLPQAQRDQRIEYVKQNPKQREFFRKFVYSLAPMALRAEGLVNDLRNLNPWPHYPFASIQAPTLVIQAREDSNGNYDEALMAAEKIPKAELVTVEQSGHLLWFGEHTDEWEGKLVDFLKKHTPN